MGSDATSYVSTGSGVDEGSTFGPSKSVTQQGFKTFIRNAMVSGEKLTSITNLLVLFMVLGYLCERYDVNGTTVLLDIKMKTNCTNASCTGFSKFILLRFNRNRIILNLNVSK